MCTHGLFGFKFKKNYYLNHVNWDGYPACLGVMIVNEIKQSMASGLFWYFPFILLSKSHMKTDYHGILIDSEYIITNKLSFEEFGYIVNLDTGHLDFYEYSRLRHSYDLCDLPDWKNL